MKSNFCFIVPVWGREYTALFTDICLPLLLTAGNIRYFSDDRSAIFIIATTYRDAEVLQESRAFKRLLSIIRVKLILIDGLVNFDSAHQAMSGAYLLAMRSEEVVPGITNFIFLTPDSFWSEGSFARLYELSQEGYKAVMVLGLRINSESSQPYLAKIIREKEDNPIIENPELTAFVLQNMHAMAEAHDWLSEEGFLNSHPSQIYWKFGHDFMVAHCFHLHPLLIRSPRVPIKIATTIDGDFLAKIRYPKSSYYIVQNSSEMIGVELSATEKNWGQALSKPNVDKVRGFSKRNANALHWHFLNYRIIYSARPSAALPDPVEVMIDTVIHEIKKAKFQSLSFHYLVESNIFIKALLNLKKWMSRSTYRGVRQLVRGIKSTRRL